MHTRGVELHDPFFVREPAQSNALIVRIELLNVDAGDNRVERVSAADNLVVGHLHAANTVGGRHHRRPRHGTPYGAPRRRRSCQAPEFVGCQMRGRNPAADNAAERSRKSRREMDTDRAPNGEACYRRMVLRSTISLCKPRWRERFDARQNVPTHSAGSSSGWHLTRPCEQARVTGRAMPAYFRRRASPADSHSPSYPSTLHDRTGRYRRLASLDRVSRLVLPTRTCGSLRVMSRRTN